MEKFLFSKLETWVVLLLVVISLLGMFLFGGIALYVDGGGTRLGKLGAGVHQLASLPRSVASIATGAAERQDFLTEDDVRAFPHDEYEIIGQISDDGFEHPPHFWRAEGTRAAPLAMMTRLNRAERDEHLLIFDEERNFVRHFPVTSPSLSGKFETRTGTAAPVMLEDGSYIVFSGGADGLYRKNLCGEVIWSLPGLYHHSISIEDGIHAVLGLPKSELTAADQGDQRWNHSEIINLINIADGTIEKSIRLDDISKANADRFDPFVRNRWFNQITEDGVLKIDRVHLNKVEILSEAIADQYPDFPAGALMLSGRRLNVVAVFDPETLEILWFSHGYAQGQHDPEFIGDNKIIVFDNAINANSDDPKADVNLTSIKQHDFTTEE